MRQMNALSRGVPSTTRPPLRDGLIHANGPEAQGFSATIAKTATVPRLQFLAERRGNEARKCKCARTQPVQNVPRSF